jgi:alpha-glucosidase
MMTKHFIIWLSCLIALPVFASKNDFILVSPDESLTIQLIQNQQGGVLYYSVFRNLNGKMVSMIDSSRLGLKLRDADFRDLTFLSASAETTIDERYALCAGKRLENRNFAKEKSFVFQNRNGQKIEIILRAYNDGIAFRYALPDLSLGSSEVLDEYSEFSVNPNGKAWIQSYDWWSPAYEKPYENKIWIGQKSPHHREDGWAFPLLFNIEKENWMLITEADLDGTYCGCHVRNSDDSPIYKIALAQKDQGYKGGIIFPRIKTPWLSPWRVAIIGNLATIVESNLVFHLSAPSKIKETDWIVPGRSAWPWAHNFTTSENPDLMKKYIDLSKKMGWEYTTEVNMYCKQPENLHEIIDYAAKEKVGLFFWYNSGVFYSSTGDMSDTSMHFPALRKKELKRIKALGAKGIKIDFFQSDKQDVIQYYMDLLKETADLKLMILFHGSTIPRGWARTFPNMISMESVQGEETYITVHDFPYIVSRQNTILPFTRNVLGSMDYTPCSFSDNVYPHVTTNCHELALSVAFESGILHINDQVGSILSLPDGVRHFLSEVPVAWDDTKFLSGYPGKSFIVARKKGSNWYLGGISSYFEEKEFNIDLSFLGKDKYEISVIKDGSDARQFSYEKIHYPEQKQVMIKMLAEGGFVAKVKKID